MKKLLFACSIAFLLFAPCAFAADSATKTNIGEELSELGSDLKSAGISAAGVLGDAFDKAGDALGKTAKSLSPKACIGSWVFKNGKLVTTLSCTEDGAFSVKQTNGGDYVQWSGTYHSSASVINAHIVQKEKKGLFFKSKDVLDEDWTIDYKVSQDKEMRLSSDELPNDSNGYDFSNRTLFIKE